MVEKKQKRLGKKDWINAALDTLYTSGISAVRIEVLARELRVTKGSFYWHFKDLAALKVQMAEVWKATQLGFLTDMKTRQTGIAEKDLRALIDFTVSKDSRHDIGIRAWSLHDKAVEKVVRDIDKARLKYIETIFSKMGFQGEDLQNRTRVLYFYQVGDYITGKLDPEKQRKHHAVLRYRLLTGKKL